ncbi:hypothetical protein N0V91_004831 [Didymella pomorum]|uniref:Uncharacterized protein n=1 Tax=Didymella pomorum TaxID=749634 RepID=A0A9W8ZDL6_9PLEO|nr:hypothetical protein N0V91_004831 [Didymella pomorum]
MAQLQMGVWAGIAASGVMVMLVLLPILGCIFSRNKKTKKAVDLEESAAEKGEIIYSAPALAQTPAPTRPINAILQKPATHFNSHTTVNAEHISELSESVVDTRARITIEKIDTKPTAAAASATDVDQAVAMKKMQDRRGV